MKRTLKAIFLAVLLLLLAAAVLVWRMSGIGESGLEAWLANEIQKEVADRGDILLTFSSLDYQAPNKVVLENLHVSRPGPDGVPIDLVQVQRAEVALGELPRRGKPIVISRVELSRPVVHVDALLKPPPPRPSDRKKPTPRPLSEVLKLVHVGIYDGTIDYDDGSGESPMSWSGLNVAMDLDQGNSVWHRVHVAIDQSPLVKLDLTGDLNIDDVAVRSLALALDLNLSDAKSTQFFAPRVQALVQKYEVHGQASIRASGDIGLKDIKAANLTATVSLTDGHVTVGQYQLPLDRLDLAASVRNGRAALDRCDVDVIGGTVRADGTIDLDGLQQVNAQVLANQLDLHRLLRDQSNPQLAKRKLAGLMNAHLVFRPTLKMLALFSKPEGEGIVWSSGYVRIYNGRLVNLPIIGQIIAATRSVTNAVTGGEKYRDELQANFLGVGKRLDFTELQYFGDVVAARGRGTIAFNGDLNLVVNAGPLEGLQQYLGAVGRVWGQLSDRLLAYAVRGTIQKPQIRPLIGGG